jgi:hypothetical protein
MESKPRLLNQLYNSNCVMQGAKHSGSSRSYCNQPLQACNPNAVQQHPNCRLCYSKADRITAEVFA